MRHVVAGMFALVLLASAPASAQLTLDSVFGVTPPWGAQPTRITWAPDGGTFLYVLQSQDPTAPSDIHQFDTRNGNDRVLFAHASAGSLQWSPDSRAIAYISRGTLYVRDMATNQDRAIDKRVSDPQWSPRSDAIAYVKAADLYVATLAPKLAIRRLTRGGSEDRILNGGLDWVYPEELGTRHGFAWSPDGSHIAYMQMDERPVTSFPIVDFMPVDNAISFEKYPLSGEKNPAVALHVIDLGSGKDTLVYNAGPKDEYLPFFGWRPNSNHLVYELMNRAQTQLWVIDSIMQHGTTVTTTLYTQSDAKWVDDVELPQWLSGGRSLWILDRDGTNGLYLRDANGSLTRLAGTFRSDSLAGVNAEGTIAYVTAAYPTRRDRSLIAVPVAGGSISNLTPAPGAHTVSLAPNTALFVDTHSTLNDPPQTDLVATAGPSVRETLAARSQSLAAEMQPVEMLTVQTQYGPLDATMIKPPSFDRLRMTDPSRKFPVIVYVYGGPAAPTTTNGFGDQRALYHQLLAQNGFIVFSIDGPASQVDSDANVRLLYHNFGPGSLMGQEAGARYLATLPYVDPARIGIWGWSFGGYETAYAMTHSALFKAGAAVAPVTDWHYYDTIYTERYMGKPQDDLGAYNASSVLPAAAHLHGDLLISHGTSDDNVHMANTISLLQSFIDADKTNVDFMVYPRRTHSIAGIAQRRHLYGHMLEWWLKHL